LTILGVALLSAQQCIGGGRKLPGKPRTGGKKAGGKVKKKEVQWDASNKGAAAPQGGDFPEKCVEGKRGAAYREQQTDKVAEGVQKASKGRRMRIETLRELLVAHRSKVKDLGKTCEKAGLRRVWLGPKRARTLVRGTKGKTHEKTFTLREYHRCEGGGTGRGLNVNFFWLNKKKFNHGIAWRRGGQTRQKGSRAGGSLRAGTKRALAVFEGEGVHIPVQHPRSQGRGVRI